jgi:DNA-binding MarR family transcriptional regulator
MLQPVNDFSSEASGPQAEAEWCPITDLPVPQGARGRTALMLVKVGAMLEEIADAQLAASGLDARDYTLLAILSVDGPGSQHELARLLGRAPGIIVAEVDELERKGLVERNRDPQDRRRSRVTATAAGRTALTRADGLADSAIAELLGGLDVDELAQLGALLERGLGLGPGQGAASSGPGVASAGQSAASEPAASSRRAS